MAKIGEGHAAAMGRKGFTELAQYLPAFNHAGTNVVEDQGIWPNKTPGEISEAREGASQGKEQEGKMSVEDLRSYAEEKAKEAEKRMDGKGQEREQERGGPEL